MNKQNGVDGKTAQFNKCLFSALRKYYGCLKDLDYCIDAYGDEFGKIDKPTKKAVKMLNDAKPYVEELEEYARRSYISVLITAHYGRQADRLADGTCTNDLEISEEYTFYVDSKTDVKDKMADCLGHLIGLVRFPSEDSSNSSDYEVVDAIRSAVKNGAKPYSELCDGGVFDSFTVRFDGFSDKEKRDFSIPDYAHFETEFDECAENA